MASLRRLLLGAAWALVCAQAASEATLSATSTPPPVPSTSTCSSRTINFITETLPQQCLRTDWSSNATSVGPQNGYILITGPTSDVAGSGGGGSSGSNPTAVAKAQESDGLIGSPMVSDEAHTTPSPAQDASPIGPDAASDAPPGASAASAAEGQAVDQEEDPLSDTVNFVSFEEWKAKMLEKAGQSADHNERPKDVEARRHPAAIHQALDSLSDDTELELEFGGFVDADAVATALPSAKLPQPEHARPRESDIAAPPVSKRSKKAGTTSKERFNYASVDCAATVRKANSECKGLNSILSENKDSYMLNPCAVKNKFFIIELCSDIQIDTIALANYEFFSSTFRQIRFSVTEQYPVKPDKWLELGVFESQNKRGVQAFLIENPQIFTRYLRVEFLGHYGTEYYCPVSLIRVHGVTELDEYKADSKEADDAREVAQLEQEIGPEQEESYMQQPGHNQQDVGLQPATFPPNCRGPGSFNDTCPRTNYFSPLVEQAVLFSSSCASAAHFCNMELTRRIAFTPRATSWLRPEPSPLLNPPGLADKAANPPNSRDSDGKPSTNQTGNDSSTASDIRESAKLNNTGQVPASGPLNTSSLAEKTGTDGLATPNTARGGTGSGTPTHQTSTRTPTQAVPAASPSTQESFFKTVHKRLQLLESNSTLSLQYIEEQSRLLREAFTKVEKRQLSKTSNFLSSLNETVLSELREFRTQYDQIWQSTILELSSQREQSLKEANALSARLAILADEVIWQKRLVYLQFGLILLCLALFAFGPTQAGSDAQRYLELPVLRDILTRSPSGNTGRYGRIRSRAGTGVSFRSEGDHEFLESPPSSPSRPVSRLGPSWTARAISTPRSDDESGPSDPPRKHSETDDIIYHLPTPPSEANFKPNGHLLEVPEASSPGEPEPDPETVLRRAVSSPSLGRDDTLPDDVDENVTFPDDPPRAAELTRSEDIW